MTVENRKPGEIVIYVATDGVLRKAKIERWVESTIIGTDLETGKEVCFDQSDHIEWQRS